MKKVIYKEELFKKINEAVDMLCIPVKSTLGPCGNNVIIDHSSFTPFITNDGVTIAKNIESDDEAVNTILEFIKEASIKTDDVVGDGTTTTIVLLESIYKKGLKYIKDGLSPIILKKELDIAFKDIENKLLKKSKKTNKKELENIAISSSNSETIGKTISEVYSKIENKNAIEIITSENDTTTVYYSDGYIMDTNIASEYYFKDSNKLELDNTHILLYENYLDDINSLTNILNYNIINNHNLLIIADDYSEEFVNEILNLFINQNIKIYLLKNPEYGTNKYNLLKDIEAISNTLVLNNLKYESPNYLGIINKIIIDKEKTILKYIKNENTIKRLEEIKNEKNDKDFSNKRIAMFDKGFATIIVGGKTTTEIREKKMRFDDALCAINSANNGILPGCGTTLLELNNSISRKNEAYNIILDSMIEPFKQIITNAGLNYNDIYKNIKNNNYKLLFNIKTNKYENIENTSVLDPTQVVINSLKNACSIASMLLSTSNLIINEYTNNANKIDDYNNI
ncbi:MAG: hypothetical protein E7158_05605 [Firmicutes bacterium]|nr:hypothetical protein [Bacillota bacterium]